jgi:hypothetical protein
MHAVASPKLVRRLATVRRADAGPDRLVDLDRRHAAVRGRRRADGDPLHGANFAVVLLPRLQRRGAGAALAERVDAMAAPQPALSRRHLRRVACHPRRCDRLLCADGSCRLCGRDVSGLVYPRRHRLCLHHRHGRDVVRSLRGGDRSSRLAHPESHRRLLSVASVHGRFRQADPRHAAFRPVPDSAAGGDGAAADRHDVGAFNADGPSGKSPRYLWPRPSSSRARASVMLRMHSPASIRAMVPSPRP